ncbi:MAG: LysM peptidoglycan-binding domain-containing protein [Firmicutes bacterium]|nr:LysM peptidoglycan-binding domain-containing protein [Bacillota bacterium]
MKSRQAVYRKRWRINPARLLMNIFLLLSIILVFLYFTRTIAVQEQERDKEVFIDITIEKGDSLWSIARSIYPNRDPRPVVAMIRDLNGLQENPTVFPGQILKIPVSAKATGKKGGTAAFFKPVP